MSQDVFKRQHEIANNPFHENGDKPTPAFRLRQPRLRQRLRGGEGYAGQAGHPSKGGDTGNSNINHTVTGLSNDPLPRRGAHRAGWVTRPIPYNPLLKERARQLRKHMTLAEVLLWNQLKNKKMSGYDFDRQRPVMHYIVDFFCKEMNLAIEIDGQSHDFKSTQDDKRQKQLEGMGIRFIRFWDYEVKHDIKSVLDRIREWILKEEQGPRKGHAINNE